LKSWFHYDDALDYFWSYTRWAELWRISHRTTGNCDGKSKSFPPSPLQRNGLAQHCRALLWLEQLKAIGITIALPLVGTSLIGFALCAVLSDDRIAGSHRKS